MEKPSRRRILRTWGSAAVLGGLAGCNVIFDDESVNGSPISTSPSSSANTPTSTASLAANGIADDVITRYTFGPDVAENTIDVSFDPVNPNESLNQELPSTPTGEQIGVTFDRIAITPTITMPFSARLIHTNARPITLPDIGLPNRTTLTFAYIQLHNITDSEITSTTIGVTVDQSLLNELAASWRDVYLFRYTEGEWQLAELTRRGARSGAVNFDATLPGFSWLYATVVPGTVPSDRDLTPPSFESINFESRNRSIVVSTTVTDAASQVRRVTAYTRRAPDQARESTDLTNPSGDRYEVRLPDSGRYEFGDNVSLTLEAEDSAGNTTTSAPRSFLQPVRPNQFPYENTHSLHGTDIDGVSVTVNREQSSDRRFRISISLQKNTLSELYGKDASQLLLLYPETKLELVGNPVLGVDGAVPESLDTALLVYDLASLVSGGVATSVKEVAKDLIEELAIEIGTSFLSFDEPPTYTTVDETKAVKYDFTEPQDIATFDSLTFEGEFRLKEEVTDAVVTVLPNLHGARVAVPENTITSTIYRYPYEYRRQIDVKLESKEINWQHSLSGRGSLASDIDFHPPRWVTAEHIDIDPGTTDRADPVVFAPDADINLNLRVHEPSTGKALDVYTEAGAQSYAIQSIDITSVYKSTGEIRNEPTIFLDQRNDSEHEDTRMDVSVSGDREIFTGATFSDYIVEVLDGTEVIGRTDEWTVGIGYEATFEQRGNTIRITRDDGVESDWYVEFSLVHPDDRFEILAQTEVSHQAGDDMFDIPIGDMSVERGSYPWWLEIYKHRDAEDGERLIGIPSFTEDTWVSIG